MGDEEDTTAGVSSVKRELENTEGAATEETPSKKPKPETDAGKELINNTSTGSEGESNSFVAPGTVGVTTINDNDVLSGRGGGTNLHPGNRQFRDLINLYRRDYLKARKNDKPAISRSIVNAIREKNGRFLKKVEKTGLWFEIGDDAAREKTSQALRQRAPEMRKLLLDHELEGARQQQHMMGGMGGMMAMPPGVPPMMMPGMQMPMMMPNGNMAFNPAMMGMANAQMFNPAMMGMPPMFAQPGMPQQQQAQPGQQPAQGGMANAGGMPGGDGGNNTANAEGNHNKGDGNGGDANNNDNSNGSSANNTNTNIAPHPGAMPPGMMAMGHPMAAMNMAMMNPAAMQQMNMAAMAHMPGMQQPPAPAPESPAPVQQGTM